ncbi:MAG: hypothetical protein ACREF3_14340, partial [Acetobacteraceae bacterium]
MSARGPIVQDSDNADSQYRRFAILWTRASAAALNNPQSHEAIAANAVLLSGGFSVIYNDCSDFFRQKGILQQRLSFFRDTTGAVIPVVTGALGLVSGAGNAIAALGLSGGAVNSGISVVAQDFLFGADNIDDVRVLILNAIGAHQNTVTALLKADPQDANFDWVVNQIMDDQAICQGPHILSLAKTAIAKGNVKAYTSASTPTAPPLANVAPAGGPAAAGATSRARERGLFPQSVTAAVAAPRPALPTRVGVRIDN